MVECYLLSIQGKRVSMDLEDKLGTGVKSRQFSIKFLYEPQSLELQSHSCEGPFGTLMYHTKFGFF